MSGSPRTRRKSEDRKHQIKRGELCRWETVSGVDSAVRPSSAVPPLPGEPSSGDALGSLLGVLRKPQSPRLQQDARSPRGRTGASSQRLLLPLRVVCSYLLQKDSVSALSRAFLRLHCGGNLGVGVARSRLAVRARGKDGCDGFAGQTRSPALQQSERTRNQVTPPYFSTELSLLLIFLVQALPQLCVCAAF